MQTISSEEFRKRYGESGVAKLAIPTTPLQPITEGAGFLPRAKGQIEKARESVFRQITGEGEFADQSVVRRGVGATAEAFATPLKVGFEALPEVTREGLGELGEKVGKRFGQLTDLVSKVPGLEKFVMENPEGAKKLEEVLGITGALGQIAGEVLLAEGVATGATKLTQKGVQVTKQTSKSVQEGVAKLTQKGEELAGVGGKTLEKIVAEPIPRPVENVLKQTTPKMFDSYADIAKKATESFKNASPLEVAGGRAQKALDTIQRKLKNIGETKRIVLDKAAAGNKPVGNIVVKFRQDLNRFLSGKTAVEGDTKLFRDIMKEAEKLGANPTAKQVDGFIDFVQERIFTGTRDLTIPVTDQATAQLRLMTRELNQSLKNQLPESYRNLNAQYSKMVETRNELNTKLGKEGERGGALMKRVFSPSDANTKQLFAEVKALTNIDLVNEATIARFVMEVLGDARQASMLAQLQLPNLSKSGLLDFLFKKATQKFNTPEAQIQRARELLLTK